MSFDTVTRNRLAHFVATCRKHLCGDFQSPGGEMVRQLAHFGIQANGDTLDLNSLTHLSEHEREQAQTLRDILDHKRANSPATKTWKKFDPTVYDLIQEQGFTALNRLCALRMAEERKILAYPCLSKGHQSDAFQLYEMRGGKNVDSVGPEERYELFLFSLFDELSLDLGALFDRRNAQGLLFPAPAALAQLLEEINDPALAPLWAEDETIGWIYQYWNSKEERKAMRDASAAPRNSRELAVRNQFFTPRYVVEFLTDNTLGRIWYEMTKGQTRLADQCRYLVRRPTEIFLGEGEDAPAPPEGTTEETLSQEELLKQPVHIPHRPVKDPREIRLLDPACGSMHFGLYAFDLFEAIYEEAWDKGLCPALQEAYPEKTDYLRDVPRLIIEHNIHGVDIDPRAVQIAGLSLWLRAQKTWKDTPAADRPRVRRSNIVCAEPMPGSDAMLEDFVQTLDPPLLGELVKTVFDKMQLAGEAGTLLKIEEEIRTAIDDAKAKWEKLGAAERDLFSAEELNQTLRPGVQQELTGVEKALTTDHRPLATDFFDTAEERIYAALRDYAESAEAGDYQRRLFAEDAAHGFAFIDLRRKRYDAVVMNPPFGDACSQTKALIRKWYPDGRSDIYAAFVVCCSEVLRPLGRMGVLSSRTGFFLSSLEAYRVENLFGETQLALLADLGLGVLDDALVEAAAYVIAKSHEQHSLFLSCLAAKDKDAHLIKALQEKLSNDVYVHRNEFFEQLPQKVVAYWVAEPIADIFGAHDSIESAAADVRIGLQTSNDYRFLRLLWEVPATNVGKGNQWIPFAKGGEYQLFYDDIHLAVNWEDGASEMKAFALGHAAKTGSMAGNGPLREFEYYFKGGLTFPERTTSEFNPRLLPDGCITGTVGPGIHVEGREKRAFLLGWLSTRLVRELLEIGIGLGDAVESGSAARHYNVRMIGRTPFPDVEPDASRLITEKVEELVGFTAEQWASDETARNFLGTVFNGSCGLRERQTVIVGQSRARLVAAIDSHSEVEDQLINSFGGSSEIRAELDQNIGPHPGSLPKHEVILNSKELRSFSLGLEQLIDECADKLGHSRQVTKKSYFADRRIELLALLHGVHPSIIVQLEQQASIGYDDLFLRACADLISFVLGAAIGRWDIRYATGERQPPELPDPFDPLPVCPPGMLQNADGLPAAPADVPDNYPLPITWSGILVSDPGHPEDIVARVRDALAVIWGDRSATIEQEACEILGVRTLRDYFAEKKSGGKFFKDHLKRYSKSRRQAPIYWPLSTESGTYTLWIYYHRLTEDTLFSCITKFVGPKQEQAEKTLARLVAKGDARTKAEDKEYEQTEALIGELATFRAELERLAKIWKPNLNDGVQITAAPLWSLFRLNPWQKKLKDTWQKLENGDYDWAHLARTLWPERVIPKCANDRSLAIAHGYEQDLWEEVENANGKLVWQPKKSADEIARKLINNA